MSGISSEWLTIFTLAWEKCLNLNSYDATKWSPELHRTPSVSIQHDKKNLLNSCPFAYTKVPDVPCTGYILPSQTIGRSLIVRKPRAFEQFSFSLWKKFNGKRKKKYLKKTAQKKFFFSFFTIYFSKRQWKFFERSGLPYYRSRPWTIEHDFLQILLECINLWQSCLPVSYT